MTSNKAPPAAPIIMLNGIWMKMYIMKNLQVSHRSRYGHIYYEATNKATMGAKNSTSGSTRNNRILSSRFIHLGWSANWPPGHPKTFISAKWKSPNILLLHIQHQWHWHLLHVIWLQPSIFSVPKPHLGHLTTLLLDIYYLSSAFPTLLHEAPGWSAAPHLKHIFCPHSQVAVS